MPLRDHFYPPLGDDGLWTGIHGGWATLVAFALNQAMPPGYRAVPLLRFGIEIDVATLGDAPRPAANGTTARPTWTPSAPVLTAVVPETTDAVAVHVYRIGTRRLVAAIEFVSPANKDRPTARTAFVGKCIDIVRSGAGLLVVDVVSVPVFNLHGLLLREFLGIEPPTPEPPVYAVSYRPLRDERDRSIVEVRSEPVALGQALPTLPLWLAGDYPLAVELEATYEETCRNLLLE